MTIAYIAHPVGTDQDTVDANLVNLQAIIRHINNNMFLVVPFCPYHADVLSFNNESPANRARGMRNNQQYFLRKTFDELWLYGTEISAGMRQEIDWAHEYGIPVIPKTKFTEEAYNAILANYIMPLNTNTGTAY